MKKFFLIPLMTLMCSVMAFANVAQITFSDEREAVDCADLAALQTAIAALPTDGTVATIQLLDDIDGGDLSVGNTNVFNFLANQKVILDLNGHDVYANLITTNDGDNLTNPTKNSRDYIFVIKNSADLTIQGGGTIENKYASITMTRVIENLAGAKLHLVNCDVKSKMQGINNKGVLTIEPESSVITTTGTASYNYINEHPALCVRGGSTTTINGGTISTEARATLFVIGNAYVTINGGDFSGGHDIGFIETASAVAERIQIKGGTFDKDPSAYVANTHVIRHNTTTGRYEVVVRPEQMALVVNDVAGIQNALSYVSDIQTVKITLGSDIIIDQVIELPHASELIIPAGRTLTVREGGLFINEGRTENNGTISILESGFFSKPASVEGSGNIVIAGYSQTEENNVIQYNISNAMQLQYLAYLVLQDEYQGKTWNISLTTDINLPSNANFEPIYEIKGAFEGNNHAINNMTMHSDLIAGHLFNKFDGNISNLTINNIDISGEAGGSGLCYILMAGSVIKNVVLNGTINTKGSASGFVNTCENLSGQTSGMDDASKHIWFVDCVNNINATCSTGLIMGGFIGTISGAEGTFGFYNCVNKGNLSSHEYAGAAVGHGTSSNVKVEFINFKNTGTITAPTEPLDFCSVADLVGTSLQAGKVDCSKIDPATYTAVWDGEKYVARLAGVIDNQKDAQEETTTSDWSLSSTWTNDTYVPIVPSESDSVNVTKSGDGVFVTNNTEAVAKAVTVETSLTIQDGGSLTIGEKGLTIKNGAAVKVEQGAKLVIGGNKDAEVNKGGITIEGTGKLIIEATEEGGTGVVLVDPAAKEEDTHVYAEIELIPDAHKDGDKYVYRYFGIPLYFEPGQEFTAANWEKEPLQDGESTTTYFRPWVNGAWAGDLEHGLADLVPFKGYGISNESTHGVKYTFKGKLVGNGDGTMNFVNGFNLFANSYTAPINIQTLLNGFTDDDVKATIYMFQGKRLRSVSKADFAGYRTPRFTVIPSMQAFFVLMDDGTSAEEIVDYSEAVFNNSLPNSGLYAPKRQETPEFNRVRINIVDENGENDEVYLIEAADFTSDFENGYDEVKYMNNGLNLFATTAYGRQTTEITNDINGTFIGIQGNGTYTLSFDELVGEEYQIRDLQTNAVVTMSEANTYTFTANGTNDARFVVESIAKMPTSVDNVSEAKLFINNNTLYISENNSNANVMIYSANGQLVLDEVAQPTVSLNGLASGVYTVRVANQTLKFVK